MSGSQVVSGVSRLDLDGFPNDEDYHEHHWKTGGDPTCKACAVGCHQFICFCLESNCFGRNSNTSKRLLVLLIYPPNVITTLTQLSRVDAWNKLIQNFWVWPALLRSLVLAPIYMRRSTLQQINMLLISVSHGAANCDSLLQLGAWQEWLLGSLADLLPLPLNMNERAAQVFTYAMNMFSILHYHCFVERADEFQAIMETSFVTSMLRCSEESFKTPRTILMTMLSKLISKIKSRNLVLTGKWANLQFLLDLVKTFVFNTTISISEEEQSPSGEDSTTLSHGESARRSLTKAPSSGCKLHSCNPGSFPFRVSPLLTRTTAPPHSPPDTESKLCDAPSDIAAQNATLSSLLPRPEEEGLIERVEGGTAKMQFGGPRAYDHPEASEIDFASPKEPNGNIREFELPEISNFRIEASRSLSILAEDEEGLDTSPPASRRTSAYDCLSPMSLLTLKRHHHFQRLASRHHLEEPGTKACTLDSMPGEGQSDDFPRGPSFDLSSIPLRTPNCSPPSVPRLLSVCGHMSPTVSPPSLPRRLPSVSKLPNPYTSPGCKTVDTWRHLAYITPSPPPLPLVDDNASVPTPEPETTMCMKTDHKENRQIQTQNSSATVFTDRDRCIPAQLSARDHDDVKCVLQSTSSPEIEKSPNSKCRKGSKAGRVMKMLARVVRRFSNRRSHSAVKPKKKVLSSAPGKRQTDRWSMTPFELSIPPLCRSESSSESKRGKQSRGSWDPRCSADGSYIKVKKVPLDNGTVITGDV